MPVYLVCRESTQSLRFYVDHRKVPPEAPEALGTHRVEVYPSLLAQEMSEHLVHHLRFFNDRQADSDSGGTQYA